MLDMKHPEDCDRGMERAICASDLDSAVSFFTSNAVFVSDDGTQVSGLDQIREKLRLFMGLQSFRFTKLESFTNEDAGISLLIGEWVGEMAESDGSLKPLNGRNVEVVQRQSDGTWKFLIDHATGAN